MKTASSGASRVRVQIPHSPPWRINWREIPNLTRNQWDPQGLGFKSSVLRHMWLVGRVVEGACLESKYTSQGYHRFESYTNRHFIFLYRGGETGRRTWLRTKHHEGSSPFSGTSRVEMWRPGVMVSQHPAKVSYRKVVRVQSARSPPVKLFQIRRS